MPITDLEKRRLYMREWNRTHREQVRESGRRTSKRLKEEILAVYGKECKRCGFSDIRALQVDHINGGGVQHRKQLKAEGISLYNWLKREGFPPDFQTLCANCNWIKRVERGEQGRSANGQARFKPVLDV